MRRSKEMRQDAWKILTGSKWGWRILLNYLVLAAIFIAVIVGLYGVYEMIDVQTWESFNDARREAKAAGIDLAVPSVREMLRMSLASGFALFVQWVFSGIMAFGIIVTLLKCLRNETEGWFSGAFGGFRRPFELFWLTALMTIKIALWALLFVAIGGFVGGIVSALLHVCGVATDRKLMGVLLGCICGVSALVAAVVVGLRYAVAWYVKAEAPETGASACLKRSCEIMKGRKWNLFCFCLSYIGWFLLVLLMFVLLCGIMGGFGAVVEKAPAGGEPSAVVAVLSSIVLCGGFFVFYAFLAFVSIYFGIGHAVFYRDAKAETDAARAIPGESPING